MIEEEKKKSQRESRRDARIQRHIEALKESEQKIGQLFPVIEDQFGVVSGSKRLKANPNWRKKKVQLDDEYEHWKAVANSNVQLEPSKKEWATWINNAIQALKKDEKKKMSNSDIVKKLVNDFGLPRTTLYRLIPDEFKREYEKLTTDFGGNDESRKSQLGHLTQTEQFSKPHKAVMSDLQLENLLISELEKADVKAQTKVPFDRPYKYSQPYFADIVIGRVVMDIKGKSSVGETEARDKYFIEKKQLLPIHLPGPMVKKFAPEIASLVKSFTLMYEAK